MRHGWIAVGTALVVGGCVGDLGPEPAAPEDSGLPSFEEYLAEHAYQLDDGRWIVEEDMPFESEEAVFDYYRAAILGNDGRCDDAACRALVIQSSGRDRVWDPARKMALSYCIGDMGSDAKAARMADMMDQATRIWETFADVNFVHLSAEDGDGCRHGSDDVLFRVRRNVPADGFSRTTNARAFFPHQSANDREVIFADRAMDEGDSDLLEITIHELGHVLGLVHEQSRVDDVCGRSSSPEYRPLTQRDRYSIMGYPFCAQDGRHFSATDRQGIRYLYQLPSGHRRRTHNAFMKANSYMSSGFADDIFWHQPGSTRYEIWQPDLGSSRIEFDAFQGRHASAPSAQQRPVPVHWGVPHDKSVVLYGPGPVDDAVLFNEHDGSFLEQARSIGGFYTPQVGQFHGTTQQIFWHAPGDAPDYLWTWEGGTSIRSRRIDTGVAADRFAEMLVGHFDHASHEEILWFGDTTGWVWRPTSDGGFEELNFELYVLNASHGHERVPLLGDFDGDGRGDIFWYTPGDREDPIWFLRGSLWDLAVDYGLRRHRTVNVQNRYKPLVGDFNGDFRDDVFWYRPGPASDRVWLFNADGTHEVVHVSVSGDYTPMVGRFNGDACDDIVWHDAVKDWAILWRSRCDGTFQSDGFEAVPSDAYPIGYGLGH